MKASFIEKCDISQLVAGAIVHDKLIIKPSQFYKSFSEAQIKTFMHQYGIYLLPTEELVIWLKENILGKAIEIGAGHGAIARALKIPITDSRMQEWPEVKVHYGLLGQPLIKYADDVEKLDYERAINKYKPDTVIGSFITHKWIDELQSGNFWGVEEEKILKSVKKYINIGNRLTHKDKPILKLPHDEYNFDFLITRSANQSENRIFVFNQ